MKNMKKLLLLGVLLLNLMPHMKDGQLQLETTQQVWAQHYIDEGITSKGRLCVNEDDPTDFFYTSFDNCDKAAMVCTCIRCRKQIECDKACTTTTPCGVCREPVLCGYLCMNPNCGKESASDIPLLPIEPPADTPQIPNPVPPSEENPPNNPPKTNDGGGSVFSDPSTTCIPKEFFSYGMSVSPIPSTSVSKSDTTWCAYLTLATMVGGDPAKYEKEYKEDYGNKNMGKGFVDLYKAHGIIFLDNSGAIDPCSCIQKMKPGGKALIQSKEDHILLYYEVYGSSGMASVMTYDTSNAKWDRSIPIGDINFLPTFLISK
jgi:hypothetical protein